MNSGIPESLKPIHDCQPKKTVYIHKQINAYPIHAVFNSIENSLKLHSCNLIIY